MGRLRDMKPETALNACWGFGIACLMVGGLLLGLVLHPWAGPRQPDEFKRVDDAPLLTAQQAWEARATGYATFWIGNDYYVAEKVPKNYVDFSAWRNRME